MANNLRNLPPEVRRELLRHVKPSPRVAAALQKRQNAANQESNAKGGTGMKNNTKILLGCGAFVGCAASLPYWATQTIGNLTDRDEALTAAQVRRGPFLNSGSHDAGKDPNWDWKNGRYVYPPGFAEHLKKNQNPNETDLGPDIGPMIQEQKKENLRQQQQK